MILTVGNTKGGVGKTTVSLQLSTLAAVSGLDVLLIDADTQGTSQSAIQARHELGISPAITCVKYDDAQVLKAQVLQLAKKYDHIIIDAGGRDTGALRAALMLSSVLITPFAPRSFDVWAMEDMAKLVREANQWRESDLKAFAVLNLADATETSDNLESAEFAQSIDSFEYLDTPLRRRKAFSNSSCEGLSVCEMKAKDVKACSEIQALYKKIFGEL
jgi:chromosome partitioning protein